MITVDNLTVQVDSKTLIDDISLQIPSEELTAVTGRNGAGKSTLLKAICGDITSSGNIHYGTDSLQNISRADLSRFRAVVPQHSRLSFDFTVMEVVLMGRTPHTHGFETPADYDIAEQCLQKVDMYEFRKRSYPTLSGGEKQRVRIATALAQIWDRIESREPAYLLLDEPTSSQDMPFQHQLLFLLKELAGQGVTVLTIIHDLNLAAQYADQVAMLKNGTLLSSGEPTHIFTREIIEEAFECPIQVMKHPELGCPLIVGTGDQKNRREILSAPNQIKKTGHG